VTTAQLYALKFIIRFVVKHANNEKIVGSSVALRRSFPSVHFRDRDGHEHGVVDSEPKYFVQFSCDVDSLFSMLMDTCRLFRFDNIS